MRTSLEDKLFLYYFNIYTRQELAADSMKEFEDILGTVSFL